MDAQGALTCCLTVWETLEYLRCSDAISLVFEL